LESIAYGAGNTQGFWKLLEGLEVLETNSYIPELFKTLQTGIKLFRMRKLRLGLGVRGDVSTINLIMRCPMLQDLEWDEICNQPLPVHHIIQDACWPHLKRLSMDFHMRDHGLAYLLQRVWNDHTTFRLRLATCVLGAEASADLAIYYNALVEVNLMYCDVPSAATLDLLRHCPGLVVMETRGVMAKDIVAEERWVCQRLRKLLTCFWFEESEAGLQPVVFECLSALIRLEELVIYIHKKEADVMSRKVLKFRLEDGMGQLASLQELTSFQFLPNGYWTWQIELGMEEFEWIKEHWKRLKMVKGRLNSSSTVSSHLKVAFEELGIKVVN
jgi:hypothetical protein